jgi:bisphosphoglycerate-dependent phosphoglycerate mutase
MNELVLLRHGESVWNLENRFTGWTDVVREIGSSGHELKYAHVPEAAIPVTESLKNTIDRFLPFWHEQIAPKVAQRELIIVSAHGNTLRALVKYLDQISDRIGNSHGYPSSLRARQQTDASHPVLSG